MKILFVISNIANGGAERVLQVLCERLGAKFDLNIAVLEKNSGKYDFRTAKILNLNATRRFNKFYKYFALRRCIKNTHPDVIIGLIDWTNVACVVANLGLKIPLIATEHGDHLLLRGVFAWVRDLAYKGVSALCVLTKHDLAYYSRFVRRCELIYNPFFGLNSSSKKENVILSVARLEPVKDYDTYFRALSLIDSAILRNYKIKIAGSGSLEAQLKQKASNLGIEIKFLGHVKDIAPLYQKAKIIVLSSLFEGLPNVLIEAAFYDCARLASNTSGAKELIDDGKNGLLFARGDEFELAKKLEKLMTDDEFRLNLTLGARANLAEFDADVIAQKWEKLIASVVKNEKN